MRYKKVTLLHDILEKFDLINTALNLNESTVEDGIIYY